MSRDLPDYANATPEDLARDCGAAIEECDARIAALVAVPAGQRVRVLLNELVEIGLAFEAAVAEWKDAIVVSRDELDGLPDSFIDGLRRDGDGYRVSLDYPEYDPFLAEARSAARRRELLEKGLRKGGPENIARLERAIAVRREVADLLGYPSWASYVIETRMAGTPQAAASFLDDLRERAAAKAATDLEELADASEQAGGPREIMPWDLRYAISRLKQARYAVDELEIAQYLPLDACLEGLFATTGSLLGIRFEEVPGASAWHPEVRTFEISEAASGEALGRCYLDLFPRPDKYQLEHWCWEPAVLSSFARHYLTGEPMPDHLLEGLIAAKTVASGVLTLWELSLSTLDLTYHSAGYDGDTTATLSEVSAQHRLHHIDGTHLQSGFIHLFGYDAAYYGYLWSQVIGDDMYTRFEAAGPLDANTGAAYRRAVLNRGGTVDGEVMVRDFLGRDPDNAAFLRRIGLSAS